MSRSSRIFTVSSVLACSMLAISSCGRGIPSNSSLSTVNTPHTSVKKQSIGNCWSYAVLGWIESMVLKNTGDKRVLNLSETYLTFRDFEYKLYYNNTSEIQTGNGFENALKLIGYYGVIEEGDFVPTEADAPISAVQERAVREVNASLQHGALANLYSITEPNARINLIETELIRIFGVDWQKAKAKIIKPENLTVLSYADGTNITLAQLTGQTQYKWTEYAFPQSSERPSYAEYLPLKPRNISGEQISLLRRAFAAMNDGYPLLLTWFVDFNAYKKGVFSYDNLRQSGIGRQGYHMTVTEDYVVYGTDPSTGRAFRVEEGDVSAAQKQLAAQYGILDYFVIKNSWGVKPDDSYYRDGTWGYSRLQADYLYSWLGEKNERTGQISNMTNGLTGIVLPPGY